MNENQINIEKLIEEFDTISKRVNFMTETESFYNFESSTKNIRTLTSSLMDLSRVVSKNFNKVGEYSLFKV